MSDINCAVDCVNGCIRPDQCPNKSYRDEAFQFIADTSLERMLEMAQEAVTKKMMAPPQWVYPEDEKS